jgi:hypothetical protein
VVENTARKNTHMRTGRTIQQLRINAQVQAVSSTTTFNKLKFVARKTVELTDNKGHVWLMALQEATYVH